MTARPSSVHTGQQPPISGVHDQPVLLADGCRLTLRDASGRPLFDGLLGTLSLIGVRLVFVYTPTPDPDDPNAPEPPQRTGTLTVADAL
jgi:hypothetical protein